MIINVKELEEFQFIFGDPRPTFARYLETFSNMILTVSAKPASIKEKKSKKTSRDIKDTCTFRCKLQEGSTKMERYFKEPKNIEAIKDLIQTSSLPLIVIPLLIVNKLQCASKNRARHMCLFVINKFQNTIERIDIKRYHLKEFNIKRIYVHLDKLLSFIGYTEDTKPKLLNEVDISMAFQKKHAFENPADGYPVYVLAYLTLLNKHPDLSQNKVLSLVHKLNKKQLIEIWNSYVQFSKSFEEFDKKKCEDGKVRNQENGRCMAPLSKSFLSLVKDKPPKPCKAKEVYSEIRGKCVPPNKNIDIDILMNEITSIKYNPNKILTHLDSAATTVIKIIHFLMSKYSYAKFILPENENIKYIQKKDFKLVWTINKNDAKLTFPPNYWDMFKKHLYDPTCRFIITLVNLAKVSDAAHANCLIYDKTTNEIERFDPLGVNISGSYKLEQLDEQIKKSFLEKTPEIFSKQIRYYEPLKYCPKSRILQSMEMSDIPGVDLRGNCAVWNWWYIHIRLANPSVKRKDIIDIASKKVEKVGGLYKFIKSYQTYMLNVIKKS